METVKVTRTCICVGGPHDGQRFDATGATFSVPVRVVGLADRDAKAEAPVLDCVYQEMVFHTPAGSISLWAEKGASEQAIMEKLLLHYMKGH